MKVLVVGSGGREHAIVWSLSKSNKVKEIYCAPGNGGIESIAKCIPISAMDFDSLADFAQENKIDLTVIGMDAPLAEGIVDIFEQRRLAVFGPRKNAAILEGSKAFSKNLMKKYNIPTAAYEVFDTFTDAHSYINTAKLPLVIKADGLALGKGVIICNSIDEANDAICKIMVKKSFGDSGSTVVIEEFLTGTEMSLLCFCDGKTIVPMVSAQDYKKAYDGNIGPNTGGMGSKSPSPLFTDEIKKYVYEHICIPTVNAMICEGREFKGVIYFGLMLTGDGVKVLEYNARFGDPEAQAILPRLNTDLFDILTAVCEGRLNEIDIKWADNSSCCVILASGGYPGNYDTGYEITGVSEAEQASLVFHAGTKTCDEKLLTAGGRVLGVTSLGSTAKEASEKAYSMASKIDFYNKYSRNDIG